MNKIALFLLVALIAIVGGSLILIEKMPADRNLEDISEPQLIFTCVQSDSFPGKSLPVANAIPRGVSGFFPKGIFGNLYKGHDEFVNNWYGKHLAAAGETSLLDASEIDETYRFTWLRSFHRPVIVTVNRRGDDLRLIVNELYTVGKGASADPPRRDEILLSRVEFCRFLTELEASKFWNLATVEKVDANDGAQWIIEGRREGRYHIVDRFSPESGRFRNAAVILLELAGVEPATLGDDLY